MGTPLYNTDIIPLTSRPTLTVMDDGDYFVILDTSTGKISKILKTNIMTALKITYDNTSGLTAETVQAALDELVVNLGSSDSAILALSGRLDTLEGTGEGSVAKAIDDAVSPLAEVVDTNRLYSDSQYIELKAKADSLQVKCNTLQAEVYTDAPILQYGAVEIIGKGYEADATPIDVSANVVDGSLELEQKGLTIINLVSNGNVATSLTSDGSGTPIVTLANGTWAFNGSGAYSVSYQAYNGNIGDKILFRFKIKDSSVGRIERRIAIVYSNGTTQNDGQTLDSVIETHSIITLNSALPFNVYITEGTIGLIERDYQLAYNLTALGLDHITDTAILAKLLPYVDGTKSVGKMGVQILDADDEVTQTIFLPAIGNSLPNGVADSIKTVSDGWEHTKRVERYVLQESDINTLFIGSNINVVFMLLPPNHSTWTDLVNNNVMCEKFYQERSFGGFDNVVNVGQFYTRESSDVVFGIVSKTDPLYTDLATAKTTLAGTVIYYQLATPIITKYPLPHLTSGKTIHRFAGEEKIALYGTGLTFSENVLTVLSAVKFVAGVMTDITSLATITGDTVTFSGVSATDVVYVKVKHDVDRPLGILEHTPAVSNTASRLASLEARVSALEV